MSRGLVLRKFVQVQGMHSIGGHLTVRLGLVAGNPFVISWTEACHAGVVHHAIPGLGPSCV